MIVLFLSAKVGHRQTTYMRNPLTLGQRVFCVHDVADASRVTSFCYDFARAMPEGAGGRFCCQVSANVAFGSGSSFAGHGVSGRSSPIS